MVDEASLVADRSLFDQWMEGTRQFVPGFFATLMEVVEFCNRGWPLCRTNRGDLDPDNHPVEQAKRDRLGAKARGRCCFHNPNVSDEQSPRDVYGFRLPFEGMSPSPAFPYLISALGIGIGALFQDQRAIPADTLPESLPIEAPFGLPKASEYTGATADGMAQLGRLLFFDPLLSKDRSIACASCHRPELGFADDTALSEGVGGNKTLRNAPSLFNRAYGASFMWDGRAKSLEEQVLLPIQDAREMDLPLTEAIARIRSEESYTGLFDRTFGRPADEEGLSLALASFVRRLKLGDSPVDRFRAGERGALSAEARSGLWFYESRGGCWRCHVGANFTDEDFHNTGIGVVEGKPLDGRFAVTKDEADRGRFKTPTLRGVALTAPYMHDGSLKTLEEVVAFYRRGGHPNSNLDGALAPIEMTDADGVNLVAFLRALSE